MSALILNGPATIASGDDDGVSPGPRNVVGPNLFGYVSVDSDEPDGPIPLDPVTNPFIDISTTGMQVTFFDADALPTQNSNADDGIALGIPLTLLNSGGGFPFFGELMQSVNMSSNGFLHFALDGESDALANSCPLADATAPNNLIAAYWDDLVLRNPPSVLAGGYVEEFSPCPYADGGDGDCVVFQWDNADHFGGGIDSFDFQAVLYENGNILMLYPEGPAASPTDPPFNPEHGSGSTTGIENADASDGLTHACNSTDSIPANFAILFIYPTPTATLDAGVAPCREDAADPVDPLCAEECATEDALIVAPGTDVRICYRVVNTGTEDIRSHVLIDNQLGVVATGNAFDLGPGDDNFFTIKVNVTADVTHIGTIVATTSTFRTITLSDTVIVRIDSDGDGVPDADDICPGSDDAEDADGDGTPDGCDGCPDDAAKTLPGVCGCGVADTDSDGDDVADCNDVCVGFDDALDSDGDGVPDGCDDPPAAAPTDEVPEPDPDAGMTDLCGTCGTGISILTMTGFIVPMAVSVIRRRLRRPT